MKLAAVVLALASWQVPPAPAGTGAEIDAAVRAVLRYEPEPAALDVWQTPLDSLGRGTGDCEDFALLAAWLALRLGVAPERMVLRYGELAPAAGHGRVVFHVWLEIDGRAVADTAAGVPRRARYGWPVPRDFRPRPGPSLRPVVTGWRQLAEALR